MGRTVAFFSYTRGDDAASDGRLSAIRAELERRLRVAMGDATVEVFQDTDDIKQGEEWAARLEEGLRTAVFLIPVITPGYFASEACMAELARFRKRESELGRADLILPIYWMRDHAWENGGAKDDARRFIYSRQYDDWRALNYPDVLNVTVAARAVRMADDLVERVHRIDMERAQAERAELERAEQAARENAARRAAERESQQQKQRRIEEASRLAERRERETPNPAAESTAPPPRKPSRWLGSAAVAAMAAFGGYWLGQGDPVDRAIPATVPMPVEPAALTIATREPGSIFKDCPDCPDMVVIPAGTFTMGSPERVGNDTERPQRDIAVPTFALARTEVTFDQWDACVAGGGCRSNPEPDDEGWGRKDRPVINVSWADAQEYIAWLNGQVEPDDPDGPYRLPSEAEWEYAARAGKGSDRVNWWGEGSDRNHANCWDTGGADIWENTAPVASLAVSPFGLHDMIGNVWEWTADTWHGSYEGAPVTVSSWSDGETVRVIRGGSWSLLARLCRAAFRNAWLPVNRYDFLGFRPARGQASGA